MMFEQLLKALGATQKQIDSLKEEGADVKQVADALRSKIAEVIRPDIEAEFEPKLKEVENAALAKATKQAESTFRKTFGLSGQTIPGDTLAEVLANAKELIEAKQGKPSDEMAALRKQLAEYQSKIEDLEGNIIPGIEAKAKGEIKQYQINSKLQSLVGSLPLATEKVDAAYKALMGVVGSEFSFDLNDKGEMVVLKDGKPAKKADGSDFMDAKEIFADAAKTLNLLKQSNAPVGAPAAQSQGTFANRYGTQSSADAKPAPALNPVVAAALRAQDARNAAMSANK